MASKKRPRKRPAPRGVGPRQTGGRGGFPGGVSSGQMQQLMQQAQQLQENMQQAQEDLEEKEFEHTAGGGMIRVKVNGAKEILELEIRPEVIDPEDPEMLQDLLIAAINGAFDQVDQHAESEMGQFDIPGIL